MRETTEEVEELQRLLEAAYGRSTEHLQSIITGERRLTAAELVEVLQGMCTQAAKARQLRARPAASISYVDGERIGVFSHGQVEFLGPEHPDFAEIEDHLVAHYGSSPSSWADDIVYCRLQPHWMVGYAFDKSAVLGKTSAGTA